MLPHQFSGYKGQIWFELWRYDVCGHPIALSKTVQPLSASRPKQTLTPRMDCAVTSIDAVPGLALFAGGCGDHPQRCQRPNGFFKSSILYDSLVDEWRPLPDMPTRRHGPAAASIGTKVYVLGGQYVDEDSDDEDGFTDLGPRFCDVFDMITSRWMSQPWKPKPASHAPALSQLLSRAAFFGAAAVAGRVVACLDMAVAFNPEREDDHWRVVETSEGFAHIRVGRSSCACSHQGELVVVSGRPAEYAVSAAAFRFTGQVSDEKWHAGEWRQLPDLNHARVGGALVSVEGRLYAMGGVDEFSGEFFDDVERLDEHLSPPQWTLVPWVSMPRALHAQDCIALPVLAPRDS
eukprot:gnl/MRDRNA2_/MRDRNA2_84775_c0_seq1.p1 gnl/MRDRNA2_/MRDRNA2_84775_c0~~gnl/MRDRNA2_/MRDRNA2_84775_c0_seq1.p1  ORF type:complete len:348 (+),score=57.67 gnl/MRDRNA2_/MRDRNA2_84775_c0_seq1:340-1383(+)